MEAAGSARKGLLLVLAVYLGWTAWGIDGLIRKSRFDRLAGIAGLVLIVLPLLYPVTTAAFLGKAS